MRRIALWLVVTLLAALAVSDALAKPPKGSVKGRFTIGFLAEGDELSKYVKASNVFCVWKGTHVIVHVSVKNGAAEHVTMSIKPRYKIARGGEHGSGGFGKDFGFDADAFRSLWIDAGEPKGVKPKATIRECSPYLFLIKSG